MRVLGINAICCDPAAAPVVDGESVAAVGRERISRHGQGPVPFAAWELPEVPEVSASWCLAEGGMTAGDVDVVAHSSHPALILHAAESAGERRAPTPDAESAAGPGSYPVRRPSS